MLIKYIPFCFVSQYPNISHATQNYLTIVSVLHNESLGDTLLAMSYNTRPSGNDHP